MNTTEIVDLACEPAFRLEKILDGRIVKIDAGGGYVTVREAGIFERYSTLKVQHPCAFDVGCTLRENLVIIGLRLQGLPVWRYTSAEGPHIEAPMSLPEILGAKS